MDTSAWILIKQNSWFPWTSAILGSLTVGLSGVAPLLVIPSTGKTKDDPDRAKRNLNRQLSFAVGGLLGDVFLHLIPEAYGSGKSVLPTQPFDFSSNFKFAKLTIVHFQIQITLHLDFGSLLGSLAFCSLKTCFNKPHHLNKILKRFWGT